MTSSRKGLPPLVALLVIVLAIVALGYWWTSNREEDKGTYTDTTTGFTLSIPEEWHEIGYSVEKEMDEQTGAQVFHFIIDYKDKNGESQKFSSVSTIAAIPVSQTPAFCESERWKPSCDSSVEIGRSNTYLFLSLTNSPEAWADCTQGNPRFDQAFYERNKTICDMGREALSYPERNAGAFIVSEPGYDQE